MKATSFQQQTHIPSIETTEPKIESGETIKVAYIAVGYKESFVEMAFQAHQQHERGGEGWMRASNRQLKIKVVSRGSWEEQPWVGCVMVRGS